MSDTSPHTTHTEAPLLETRGLTASYPGTSQGRDVLRGVNLRLGQERLGLIGANGSGKTTLLHCLMGLMQPRSGEIFFEGRPLRGEKDFRVLRRGVGFVFQNPDDQLFMPTVLEDVAFGPLNQGLSPREARQRAEETLGDLGLEGYGERLTHRLSGGEKRLVSLATVLAMRPKVLLLDEPTNDLDPGTRERCVELLNSLPQAMFIVSHDWDFLDRIVNRLAVMHQGRLEPRDTAVLHRHVHAHPAGDAEHAHPVQDLAPAPGQGGVV
jgi:cobalt/nickel transport system ATP-binding protein